MRALVLLLVALLSGLLLAGLPLRADERTQKLLDRLAREAEAFEKVAPQVMGVERLHQRALTPPPRFKVRVGKAAEQPLGPTWQEREMVSEYGFTVFGNGSIQELRQVMNVNGKQIADTGKAEAELARLVTGSDELRKRRALQQMERHGLRGGATDLGQMLLLFARSSAERYEISYEGSRMVSPVQVQVFRYRQLDGPEALTLFRRDQNDQARHLSVEGEIWVRESGGTPVHITMVAIDSSSDQALREEVTVDYAMSEFGAVLPVETHHKELRAGEVVAENTFTYEGFHRFGTAR
jgi:hypothetical protein